MAKEQADVFKTLREVGLDDTEVKVYESCLHLGRATASKIAERSNVPRTTTYDVLRSLMEKGLVCCVKQDNISSFEANMPEALIASLDEKKELLSKILPELKKIKPNVAGDFAETFPGKSGVKAVMEGMLLEKKPIIAFSSTDNIFGSSKTYIPQFIKKRVMAGIAIRLLTEKTPGTIKLLKARDSRELRETRFIPGVQEIPCTIYVYGDKVALLNTDFNSPSGVLIKDKNIAATLRLVFESLWGKAEK